MPLHKIKDFYPDYRSHFDDHDILGYGLYSGEDKIGSVDDLLVDDEGRFRYLIVNTGAWIFGKKVLLPIGRARINYNDRRVYVDGLSREQVETLPEYDPNQSMDYDYEERVRGVYRPTTGIAAANMPVDTSASLDATPGLRDRTTDRTVGRREIIDRDRDVPSRFDRSNYRYDAEPELFGLNDQNHQNLRLYEERLIADKTRVKTGEVTVGKHIETETQHVSVPIEKERVVIERVTPTDATVASGVDAFNEGEVARVEVFEETPDIRKETIVREEVRVRKEVDRDTVERDETIRRERLNVDQQGNPVVQDNDLPESRI